MWRLAFVLAVGWSTDTDTTVLIVCCLFCCIYIFKLHCFVENKEKQKVKKLILYKTIETPVSMTQFHLIQ